MAYNKRYLLIDGEFGLLIGSSFLLIDDGNPMTFGDMVSKISTEIRAVVPTADIKAKIIEAIETYKHHNFWFNEIATTMNIYAGQRDYVMDGSPTNAPEDILKVQKLDLVVTNRPLTLESIDPFYILSDSSINTPSTPYCWSIHHNAIMLYPTPSANGTVNLYYVQDFNEVDEDSADSATNYWFNEAERLIRSFAKALIFGELLRNDTEQDRCVQLASRAYLDLKAKSSLRGPTFTIEPWDM